MPPKKVNDEEVAPLSYYIPLCLAVLNNAEIKAEAWAVIATTLDCTPKAAAESLRRFKAKLPIAADLVTAGETDLLVAVVSAPKLGAVEWVNVAEEMGGLTVKAVQMRMCRFKKAAGIKGEKKTSQHAIKAKAANSKIGDDEEVSRDEAKSAVAQANKRATRGTTGKVAKGQGAKTKDASSKDTPQPKPVAKKRVTSAAKVPTTKVPTAKAKESVTVGAEDDNRVHESRDDSGEEVPVTKVAAKKLAQLKSLYKKALAEDHGGDNSDESADAAPPAKPIVKAAAPVAKKKIAVKTGANIKTEETGEVVGPTIQAPLKRKAPMDRRGSNEIKTIKRESSVEAKTDTPEEGNTKRAKFENTRFDQIVYPKVEEKKAVEGPSVADAVSNGNATEAVDGDLPEA